jgi:hypothetical protein
MQYVAELAVPSDFNEFEVQEASDCTIRTLVDFSLCDEKGNFVGVEELGTPKAPFVILRGTVLEPLSASVREGVISLLCTTQLESSEPEIVSQSVNEVESLDSSVPTLNRGALVVGDTVDGYCNKTYQWYEAKIIDASNDPAKGDRLKIHFKGWSGKHDEWINRSSERIAALGTSAALIEAAKQKATCMVPWFDIGGVEKLMNGAIRKDSAGAGSARRKIAVEIRGLEDYCVDYSYANPTLWLISAENIWYRVAGPLCPGGRLGSPSPEYSKVFAPTVQKFSCAAHMAMVLLDFLPSIPKMGLDMVAAEVQARTKGEFDETVLLSNWKFLVDQLKTISPPAEWESNVDIAKSTCLSQLKKQGESYIRGGGKPGITNAAEAGMFKKTKAPESAGLKLTVKLKKPEPQKSEEALELEAYKQAINKIKFPIEDKDYWQLVARFPSKRAQPFPSPLFSNLLNSPHRITCSGASIGSLLQVWTTLINFRELLSLPIVPLTALDCLLLPGYGNYAAFAQSAVLGGVASTSTSYFTSMPGVNVHPMLREIFIGLLTIILIDKQERGLLKDLRINVSDYKSAYTDNSSDDSSEDSNDDDNDHEKDDDRNASNCFLGWFPPGLEALEASGLAEAAKSTPAKQPPMTKSPSSFESKFQNYLRTGSTWVEVFRTLIAAEQSIEMSEYFDPISECEKIVKILLKDPDGDAFANPVNPEKDKVPDYLMIIKEPMDLGTILKRIRSGWYDPDGSDETDTTDDASSLASQTIPKFAHGSVQFAPGNLIDVFNTSCQRWYEAEVLSVNNMEGTMSVRVRGWAAGMEETVDTDSDRVAPAGSFSKSLVRIWNMLISCIRGFALIVCLV